VREVCSVSECLSPGPEGWISAWEHNRWGAFDDPERAWALVPEAEREAYGMYAWAVLPTRWVDGREEPFEVEAREDVAALRTTFEPLGYDVVSRGSSEFFECSPLTCNLWGAEVGANRHGLVDTLEAAAQLAARAEASGCEPGPYHVVRVWRQRARR